jgi:hypothetical protein
VSLTGQQVADTAGMRAEADQLAASVREDNRVLLERDRRARQLAYEADLIDRAEEAKAEYEGAEEHLEELDAKLPPLVAAEREAEDHLSADRKRLASRVAELSKAETDDAPGEQQEDLAARVVQLGKKAAVSQANLDEAISRHAAAEAKRDEWARQVTSLYAEHAAADRAARNPGIAPNMPALAPGVARISDLDEEQRQYIAFQMILLSHLRADPAPASPDPAAAMKDKTKFRMLSLPGGRGVIVPPAMS